MKRILVFLIAGIIFAGFYTAQTHASVNNFSFDSFDTDYYLSKDADSRSQMKVIERFVAVFPDFDQNHGIERAIPNRYDGHPVRISVKSVTSATGRPLHFTVRENGSNTIIRIGANGTYVHGSQSYKIIYTLHDVTKKFSTGDELYWDTNGDQWQQKFSSVTARVHIPADLSPYLDSRTACYSGRYGSTDTDNCTIAVDSSANETIVTASAIKPLQARENLSFVIGFAPNTFSEYVNPPTPLWVKIITPIAVVLGAIWYVILPIYLSIRMYKRWQQSGRDASIGKDVIVPEYLPPKGITILLSSVILTDTMKLNAISATILNLAVHNYIKIYELEKDGYELEITKDIASLSSEEQKAISIVFNGKTTIGNRRRLKDILSSAHYKIADLGTEVYDQAITGNFMVDTRKIQKNTNLIGGLLLGFSLITFNILGFIAGVVIFIISKALPARTEKGVATKEYLLGLKEYMRIAETDRIKILQSPSSAQRISVDPTNAKQLLKIYETLLPYAVLFGIEKEWAKEFAVLYTEPPSWYSGKDPVFNAAVFSHTITNFTSASVSSFAPPASSSSSGFSSGGGFSGGGGGGGGGGGW